jgi:hypothetical protein
MPQTTLLGLATILAAASAEMSNHEHGSKRPPRSWRPKPRPRSGITRTVPDPSLFAAMASALDQSRERRGDE